MMRSGDWIWGPLAASAVMHGAALATALGHPSAFGSDFVEPAATVTVDLVAMPPPKPATPEPVVERVAGVPSPARHTHPYPVPSSHDWTPHDPALVHVLTAPTEPPRVAAAAAEPSAMTADTPLPRFTIALGASGPLAPVASTGEQGRSGGDGGIESEASVSAPARLVRGVAPRYPTEARGQGIEADVPLEIVVSATGAVESARLLGHAGYGLDEAALEAIRFYRFAPASRGDHAVRVRMRWTMEFRLR